MNDKCLGMVEYFLDNSANSNYNSIAKANLDEKFVLGSKGRESINDRTGVDYAKAFQTLHKSIDDKEKVVTGIYTHNDIQKSERIFENILPLFDGILNNFSSSLEQLEKMGKDSLVPTITRNVANLVNNWIMNAYTIEAKVNQHYMFPLKTGLNGSEIVKEFIETVYTPFSKESDILTNLLKSGKASLDDTGIIARFEDVIQGFNDKQREFFKVKNEKAEELAKTGRYNRL